MDQTAKPSLQAVAAKVSANNVFGEIEVQEAQLNCAALNSSSPAWYRLEEEQGKWFVSLVTEDRWLSESIETDLLHYGDPLDELLDEELDELHYEGPPLTVKHYRSDDMLYTFRSVLPISELSSENSRDTAVLCLLAYEATFRELGDMMQDEDE